MGNSNQSAGVTSLEMVGNVDVVANGGIMATWQYAVFYNNTNADKKVLGWIDYGSSVVLNNGAKVVVQTDGVRGLIS
jgi:hypothetical protein